MLGAMATDPRLEALRALADTGARLARGTTSARLALAGLHDVVDPATLPPAVRERAVAELAAAHAATTVALAPREVEKALKDAWGEKPSSLLDAFEAEPVARTPAAQVHRGVHDGQDVAIKVLRPGIADGVRQDLNLLEALVRPLGAVFPSLSPGCCSGRCASGSSTSSTSSTRRPPSARSPARCAATPPSTSPRRSARCATSGCS
jgi:hypothetical protein